ncbi:hypothetical protein llap_20656 [Limosa lapponica baueri]|uniref:Ig-like domain-containing protein n=1 Tax=Limosa lapponica baueri TaxID=1758121 RepID=A0A2I0T5H4_LIMLA|nr:hypothetical protein llap_20656 [Limosa lapponica baueri]
MFSFSWVTEPGPVEGEFPVAISIEPSVVLVEDQVTLSCQVADSVPYNTSVLWYKMEKGRDAPLCSSSSLGGVVEQFQDEEEWRITGHWQGRALLLVILQVRVADEGTYVCALNGSVVMHKATTHLDVTGAMNEIIVPQSTTCTYKGRISGSYVKPKVMWVNPQGEDLSSLAHTSILQETDTIFTIESSIEIPCGQPPPSFVPTEREHSPQIALQPENRNVIWIISSLVLIILPGNQKEIGECH